MLKVLDVSASVDNDTLLRIVLHSVWIGPFLLDLGFIEFGGVQSISKICPEQKLIVSGMVIYAVSKFTCSTISLDLWWIIAFGYSSA